MNSIFKDTIHNWIVPNKKLEMSFYKEHLHKLLFFINNEYEVIVVPVHLKPLCKLNDCHNNVLNYINTYSDEHILGYYIAIDKNNSKNAIAVLHSIVKKQNGSFIDITPNINNIQYMIFIPLKDSDIQKYPKMIEYSNEKLYFF